MRTVLLVLAVICCLVAAAFDFGAFDSSDPHVVGWIAVGLAAFAGSFLVRD